MKFFIHYNPDSGEILGWGSSFDPHPIAGMAIVYFAEPTQPDPAMQRIDPATGELIDKTAEEVREARQPTLREVQVAVYRELVRTDHFMLPDYPHSASRRETWHLYRQILRDLSKHHQGAGEMIKNCDPAPDGTDPMTELRARL